MVANQARSKSTKYYYGMKLRGFSLGCQPKRGFVDWLEDNTGKYWSVIFYSRPLSEDECRNYDLEFIEAVDE